MENHVGRHVAGMGELGAKGQELGEMVSVDAIPVALGEIGLCIEPTTLPAFRVPHVPTRAIAPKRRDADLFPLRMLRTGAYLGEVHTSPYTKTYVPPS